MNRQRRSTAGRESGATLIELLAVLILSSLVLGVIAQAIVTGFKTTGATVDRLGESHATELTANYFASDVASAAPTGITTGSAATGCSGASPGTNVVLLPYATAPGDEPRRTDYRFDAATNTVTRYHCAEGSTATEIVVARLVESAQATLSTAANGQTTVTLSISMIRPAGQRFEVTGHSRTPTPAAPLPDPPPPTTAAPLPCKVDSATATPDPVTLASGTTLSADVAVTVSVSGSCVAPLRVSFVAGSSGSPNTVTLTSSGSTFVGTLSKSAYAWSVGTKTVTVSHAGAGTVTDPTFSFTVAQPCTVSTALVDPDPVALASGTTLASDVNVLVVPSGLCSAPLSVSFVPGSSGSPVTVALTPSGAAVTAVLGRSAYPWTAGTKTVTVNQAGGAPVQNSTFTFVVTATPCAVTAGSAAPNPVNRDSNGWLATNVTVTVTTTGFCSGLQIRYTPQTTPVTRSLVQTGSTWTTTIPSGGGSPKWDTGVHTISVLGASSAAPFSLTVNP